MRRPRLTLTEAAILVVVAALLSAVPLHYRRFLDRDRCRFEGEMYIVAGESLAAMADHPESWMDPFRTDFRRFSAWQMEKGRRLAGSWHYDEAEEQKRIVDAGMDRYKVAFDGLYGKFRGIAAQHGYQRPFRRLRYYPRNIFGAFFSGWPFYAGALFLSGFLIRRWWRTIRSTRPAPACGGREVAVSRMQRGNLFLILGMVVLFYSVLWATVASGTPVDPGSGPWTSLGMRMFEAADGHAIVSAFALGTLVAGIAFWVGGVRDWCRNPPAGTAVLDSREQAGLADFPRAEGPDPSP